MEAVVYQVCPTVYPSVHTSSLENVPYNEWFKFSGFYVTTNTGSSPELLLVLLLLPCVMGIFQL
jgi:hypothetical protein